ncbi:MAG: class I SAM-dependent methyltransferase [Candidatus Hydrogenedentes bacterium]|nr:class I SAM-dependent methyltransferase [Candidatus Hydrogenedentota bacterium]
MAASDVTATKKRGRFAQAFANLTKRIAVLTQYHYINRIDAEDKQVRLMNYGWIDPQTRQPLMSLDPDEEPDRSAIQLYHRVVTAVDVRDKEVLEVGSGRGGGAAYIAKYLDPRRVHGVDYCAASAVFANKYWKRPRLSFSPGNAEKLRHSSDSFDVVVNIESSHCYIHMDRFVAHAYRVLRPGGHFLFADFRPANLIDELRAELQKPGFQLVEEENLNEGVLLALDADDARKRAFIEEKVEERRKPIFEVFAAVVDSPMYKAFQSGESVYMRYVFKKPDGQA